MSSAPPSSAPDLPHLRLSYPDELPITARRPELLATIRDHQVVVVAGETGSGKSTQIPKLCLELGRGPRAAGEGHLIGHTQPRRLAARSIAERVAEELGEPLGGTVGYAVRFTDKVGRDSRLKLMTDGILLNEMQRDRELARYDTIIVDEAHERSLNIDFILGYLKQLLPRRPDLKVIVTSATIDTERFAQHFASDGVPAPIVEVSGRTHPVEIRYRPSEDPDTTAAVGDAVEALIAEGMADVLVFQSGEREIRDTAEEIENRRLPDTEVIPLFARLSAAEQHRVFAPHTGRRVVVATNIAETSLTVPGIRSVVDAGTARISRYNKRTKVQRLPIEPISQASADQRSGRCGRVAPGICIRLYGEDDYLERDEFTEPEVLRTSLASVILQMTALGLGDVESFPFLEPPDSRMVTDGVKLLEDLGALESSGAGEPRRLTRLGQRLARLPLDPTLGRMVLEAERNGCVHEVMVVAAALSIQDVRERPTGEEDSAAQMHARFRVPGSDFLSMIALWDHLRERQKVLSSSAFRREVRAEYLHYVRIREWQDVYTQLRQVARSMKFTINREPADETAIHRSLLAGLIGNVGHRIDDNGSATSSDRSKGRGVRSRPGPPTFAGTRNTTFSIGRGSVMARKPPAWVMAAELVETDRMWTRTAAAVQPSWIEHAARHLVTRNYDVPYWNAERGTAQVVERVHLRGLVLVEGRAVNLDRVDAEQARQLFVLHALVRGEWDTHHAFVTRNQDTIDEVRDLESRARRHGILVDEDAIFDYFDARIPDNVTDVRRFDRWWRDQSTDQPDLLDLSVDLLTTPGTDDLDDEAFPTAWTSEGPNAPPANGITIPIDYTFEPGTDRDGVTFEIPVAAINRTDPEPFEWLVPGLRHELITEMIRALPKTVRRNLVPAPDRAAELAEQVGPSDGPLRKVLAAHLSRMAGASVSPDVWDGLELPAHLRPRYRIMDGDDVLAEGTDVGDLERRLRAHVRATLIDSAGDLEVDGRTDWSFGDLPPVIESEADGLTILGYPSLIDTGDSVGIRVLASESEQHALHWNGIRRLLTLHLPRPARVAQREIDARALLSLTTAPHGSVTAAAADAQAAVIDAIMLDHGGLAFTADEYEHLLTRVRDRHDPDLVAAVTTMAESVQRAQHIRTRFGRPAPEEWRPALDDCEQQLAGLVFDGMAIAIGADRLHHIPRYLEGIEVRLDRLRENARSDMNRMLTIRGLTEEHANAVVTRGLTAALDDVRWQIEELRVQLFAQQLGTAETVSPERIRRALGSASA